MQKMSMSALLSAARVFVAPFFGRAKANYRLTAPTIDLDALKAARPRAVAAMPRAKAGTPEELVAEINTAFTAFKASVNDQLKAKADDTVLNEKIERINANISELTKAYDEQSKALAAARIGGGGPAISAEAAEHQTAFNAWFRRGIDPENMHELEVKAALTTQIDPDGGYLVPEQMDQTIDRVLGTVSVMRQLARKITIGTGSSYTKLINLGGTSSGWALEEKSRGETTGSRLAQISIPVMDLFANPAATQTLLDDARVDIAMWLADEISIEFAEQEGAAFITGDGTARPKGLLAYTKVADASYAWGKIGFVTSGASGGFATASGSVSPADCLVDLYYALKAGYRSNASWLTSDVTMGSIRKFKDGDGGFLWAPPTAAGEVPTVLGKPVYTDDNMDKVEANKFPIAFGDFQRAYTIVDKGRTTLLRDPYTNKPFVHFYTTKRVGGGVTNFEAVKLLKISN